MTRRAHPWTKHDRNADILRALSLPRPLRPSLRKLGKEHGVSHQRIAQIRDRKPVSTSAARKAGR
jgi:hypothetical protein